MSDDWACNSCTYLNKSHKTICDMCGKSKQTTPNLSSQRATNALTTAAGTNTNTNNDYIIDAIENFLRGPSWKTTMNTFVNSHCAMFSVIDGEHGLGQHDVFRDWRDTVDGLLQGILSDLGCSPETFIDALDARQKRPEGGPRDAAINEMVRTLMTFERFAIFKVMMHDRNKKLEAQEINGMEGTQRSHQRNPSGNQPGSSTSDRYRQRSASKTQEVASSSSTGWNCICCSFFNDNSRENCDMCEAPKVVIRDNNNNNNNNNNNSHNTHNNNHSHTNHAQTYDPMRHHSNSNSNHTTPNQNHHPNHPNPSNPGRIPRPSVDYRNATTGRTNQQHRNTSSNSKPMQAGKRKNIKPSDRKTPFQALCHENYDAQKETEMTMKQGEMVVVIDNKSSVDWWWAEVPTRGAEGWVPVGFLFVDQETAADQDKRLISLSQSLKRTVPSKPIRRTKSQEDMWAQKQSTNEEDNTDNNTGNNTGNNAKEDPMDRKVRNDQLLIHRKSSTLDEEEFRNRFPVQEDRKIRAVFEEYDRNRSGNLIIEEVGDLFKDMNVPCSQKEIEESMMRLKTFTDLEGNAVNDSGHTTNNTNNNEGKVDIQKFNLIHCAFLLNSLVDLSFKYISFFCLFMSSENKS